MGGPKVLKGKPFLFRLVNRVQPDTIIEVGRPSSTALYLQSAKPSASYLFASDLSELFLDADTSVDFLYLNDYQIRTYWKKYFGFAYTVLPLKVYL